MLRKVRLGLRTILRQKLRNVEQLSDREYEEVRSYLREVQFPNVKKIELRVIKIGFGDGTAWNAGYLFRREPNSIQSPLKGWAPVEADARTQSIPRSGRVS